MSAMWKPRWMDVGIAVVALVLVCGSSSAWAQRRSTQDGTTSQMDTSSGSGSDAQSQGTSSSVSDAQQQLEIARLRTQVARLQQQLAQMGAQLEQARGAQGGGTGTGAGVGGSGTTGGTDLMAPSSDSSSLGTGGSTDGTVGTGSLPGTGGEGVAEVGILYTGRVRSVSSGQLVLEGAGGYTSTLRLAQGVRVYENGQQVARDQLTEGRRVRTSADLTTQGHPVTRIELLPARP